MDVKMKRIPTWLPVVALALKRDDGRFLMQRRPMEKHHGGLWEFPGGKVEMGETPAFALIRELEEELGLSLDPASLTPAFFAQGPYEGSSDQIVILLYTAREWHGEPESREGGDWGWFTLDEMEELPKPELDMLFVERLREFAF